MTRHRRIGILCADRQSIEPADRGRHVGDCEAGEERGRQTDRMEQTNVPFKVQDARLTSPRPYEDVGLWLISRTNYRKEEAKAAMSDSTSRIVFLGNLSGKLELASGHTEATLQ